MHVFHYIYIIYIYTHNKYTQYTHILCEQKHLFWMQLIAINHLTPLIYNHNIICNTCCYTWFFLPVRLTGDLVEFLGDILVGSESTPLIWPTFITVLIMELIEDSSSSVLTPPSSSSSSPFWFVLSITVCFYKSDKRVNNDIIFIFG